MSQNYTIGAISVNKNAAVPASSTDLGGAAYCHYLLWLDTGATSIHLHTSTATTGKIKWDASQGPLSLDFDSPVTLYGIATTNPTGNYNLLAWN